MKFYLILFFLYSDIAFCIQKTLTCKIREGKTSIASFPVNIGDSSPYFSSNLNLSDRTITVGNNSIILSLPKNDKSALRLTFNYLSSDGDRLSSAIELSNFALTSLDQNAVLNFTPKVGKDGSGSIISCSTTGENQIQQSNISLESKKTSLTAQIEELESKINVSNCSNEATVNPKLAELKNSNTKLQQIQCSVKVNNEAITNFLIDDNEIKKIKEAFQAAKGKSYGSNNGVNLISSNPSSKFNLQILKTAPSDSANESEQFVKLILKHEQYGHQQYEFSTGLFNSLIKDSRVDFQQNLNGPKLSCTIIKNENPANLQIKNEALVDKIKQLEDQLKSLEKTFSSCPKSALRVNTNVEKTHLPQETVTYCTDKAGTNCTTVPVSSK